MFFVLSKTLSLVLEPLVHPFLLLIIALLAKWRRRRRLHRVLVVFAVGLPLLYGFLPFSQAGLMLLENRFPIPTMDERPIDGVIILGGHTGSGFVSQQRDQPQQNRSAERLTMGLKLHRQYPNVPLVFSGFSGKLFHQGWSEADVIQRLLFDLSVPLGRVQFEKTSRNTYENAVNSRQLLGGGGAAPELRTATVPPLARTGAARPAAPPEARAFLISLSRFFISASQPESACSAAIWSSD